MIQKEFSRMTSAELCQITGMTIEQLNRARKLAAIPAAKYKPLQKAYFKYRQEYEDSEDYENDIETPGPEDIVDWIIKHEQIGASAKKRSLGISTLRLRTAILAAFEETDKPVTARQMFYMLSVRNAVAKTEAGYRQVQRQLVEMRREEIVPYDWIADNTRWMRKPTSYQNLDDFLDRAQRFYRQDLWVNQGVYVEIWCEKDALAGVIYPITSEYDVPLMVARGYSSESFVYEAAENIREIGKPAYVYYLGDFDPSGWHMAENLQQKLHEFGADVTFERLAVNPDQIARWKLPARPTKRTDTRCWAFFDRFGVDTDSVELDAIPPDELRKLVHEAIERHIDTDSLNSLRLEEDLARATLTTFSQRGDRSRAGGQK